MPGLKTNALSRKEVLAAVRAVPAAKNFVWDGADEDERPASDEELSAGVTAYRKRGRPAGGATKEQVAIRLDREVLAAFRAAGPGWQTRMNDALKDWLHTHSPG
ncbi:MAG: BrnA antitoxin family protein [Polaromonas sp.]|nr:BrnA antitoxin family protein [Polaromonas sp.]